LTKVPDEQRDEKSVEGWSLYASAPQRAKQGERIISLDELTGVQALERKHPDLPMPANHVLRRELEYLRHGTLSWFINFEGVSGQVIVPSWGPTRTEEDALAPLQRLIASDPKATRVAHHAGQLEHSAIRIPAALGGPTRRDRRGKLGGQRETGASAVDGKPGDLFA
jgi:hypothetical protein